MGSRIEIGDRVTCIDASIDDPRGTGLVEGRDYIVYNIIEKLCCCSYSLVDVGVVTPHEIGFSKWVCPVCSKFYEDRYQGPWPWRRMSRFVKKDEGKEKKKEEKVSVIKLTEQLCISEN